MTSLMISPYEVSMARSVDGNNHNATCSGGGEGGGVLMTRLVGRPHEWHDMKLEAPPTFPPSITPTPYYLAIIMPSTDMIPIIANLN